MKTTLVLGFAAGLALAFASANSALAQATTPHNYYETVASTNCVGNNFCIFTFKAVPGIGILTVSSVNCRIVATDFLPISPPLASAALGKTSNAADVFPLSSSVSQYSGPTSPFAFTYSIDQATQFFVEAGISPTITIITRADPIAAPNPALDQPTCSVSGLIE